MATNGKAKVTLTAEDRTAAAFAAVGKRVDKLGFNLGSLKGAAVGALAALSVPITAGAIIGLANESAKAVLELKDLSEASGSTIENISALDKIARATGGSFETVSGVLIKFNAALKDAERTKEVGAVLKALNLDIEELRRLDPADALQKTAIALGQFADDGDKARAVQELFGRSVKEAAPFLRELADAGKLNATVTTDQVLEIDKFNKEAALMQSNVQDIARSLSIDLITALNRVIDKFREGSKEGKGFFATALQIYSENVAGFYGSDTAPKAQTFDPNDQSSAESARLNRRQSLSIPTAPGKPKKTTGGTKGGATKDPYAEAQRYLEGLQKQLEATENLSEVEQALRDIQLGRLGALKPEQEKAILDTARLIDGDKELQKATKEFADLEQQAIARKKELAEAGARVYEETRTPLEKLNAEVAELQRLLDAGAISFDTFARKNFELEEAVAGLGKEFTGLDQYTQRAAQNIQDYLGNQFSEVLKGNFSDIGSAFGDMINKMVAEAAAAKLSKYLFGDLLTGGSGSGGGGSGSGGGGGSGSGGGDGAVGGLFSKAIGRFFGGSFAVGTDFVPKDMLAVVHKGEKITPASQNRPGASVAGNTNIFNFTVGDNVDRRTQSQIALAAQRGVALGSRNA